MGRAKASYGGMLQMVTAGDVIIVHQSVAKPQAAPAPAPAKAAAAPEPVGVTAAGEPEAEEAESYTLPPPGYAYEFGTGRLVAIRPDLIRVP